MTPLTKDSVLSAWFFKITESSWAKSGIKQAAVHTAGEPIIVSGGVPMGEKGGQVLEKKIKEGLEMKVPKLGEDMYVFCLVGWGKVARCGWLLIMVLLVADSRCQARETYSSLRHCHM